MDGNPNSSELLRQFQAALKRPRPPGGASQPNIMRPKRSAAAEAKAMAMSNSQDSQSSLDQSGNHSLSFPDEMKCLRSSVPEASTGSNQDLKPKIFQQAESKKSLISDGGKVSILPRRTIITQDHLHKFKNFLSQPATQSSVVGPSCATTTSVHSSSAPMLNSLTGSSHSHPNSASNLVAKCCGNLNPRPITHGVIKSENTNLKETNRISTDQATTAVQACSSLTDAELTFKESNPPKELQGSVAKETSISNNVVSCNDHALTKGKDSAVTTNTQPEAPTVSSEVKLESSKLGKTEKDKAARKMTYNPVSFFKVSGKLYQRLGRIGTGGSSEVHKVISSECTIYALKKIKLKGRDYATAYGFCQEIEYLYRLKGKSNIIQLINYEVTDKALLEGVMKGSFNNKGGKVKDDGFIYMVLEHGEIDLAHMLSQKWKELDGCNQTIDENWLRFYWQQILQAVNTIHEERIVHSDLKPANFLLVKGSLKLIDFGIAKAIMSDTTNIQRDSQVGTLNYMSPEAFMCNESDANGNIIKCGRSSDIWSLGCILYQMVYGRTPFSDYKTFWAKVKVITDPKHQITYEPVSNPWLVDLMKKCLAWDRNERWRIPQLLQHPFLAPPVSCHPSLSQGHTFKWLQLITETGTHDQEALQLCCQLQQVLGDPFKLVTPDSLDSRDGQCKLLSRISELCFQLQERLANSDKNSDNK
ncbi:serine/threonine-protein kinase MPS1 [Lathyrus oleraceus]|uniref:Protein kinase domain-containing protein n=1 Tax=Pisum sativum TaxID=3888 RepID=A0A9D5BB27_PEA|nr:serine/threonine-protein kinase MPS1-like [Pisum sativum]KAI5435969.1 hypothetical protein KIW84_022408 [Pisum sativum]